VRARHFREQKTRNCLAIAGLLKILDCWGLEYSSRIAYTPAAVVPNGHPSFGVPGAQAALNSKLHFHVLCARKKHHSSLDVKTFPPGDAGVFAMRSPSPRSPSHYAQVTSPVPPRNNLLPL
jgi:hypothetical protein